MNRICLFFIPPSPATPTSSLPNPPPLIPLLPPPLPFPPLLPSFLYYPHLFPSQPSSPHSPLPPPLPFLPSPSSHPMPPSPFKWTCTSQERPEPFFMLAKELYPGNFKVRWIKLLLLICHTVLHGGQLCHHLPTPNCSPPSPTTSSASLQTRACC